MSSPPDWLTVEEVAAYLDIPGDVTTDDNLAASTAAVKAAVERRRDDLRMPDGSFYPSPDVKTGAVQWAALIYQSRNAPSGVAGYGDETMLFDSLGARRAEVMRLLGWRRPTTA